MAIKDHPKYLAEIDRLCKELKARPKFSNKIKSGRNLRYAFDYELDNDDKVSISDKAHLKDKLYNKFQAILLKS